MNIYIKWFLIVGLNSGLGFILGYQPENFVVLTGMIFGVFTWYLLYLSLDIYLQKNGRKNISRKLFLSAVLRIPMQLLTFPDMYAGLAAMATVDSLGLSKQHNSFVEAYFNTIFTGLYLSLFCTIIYVIITGIDEVKSRRANA